MNGMTERNLRAVDLNLLVVFDALMTERNVTRAAVRNGLSQPAMSKALSRLRYLFGDPLFVRRDRTMEPTARAIELAGPIHTALVDISRTLVLPGAFDPAQIEATVTIATIDLHHTSLLPALIQRLRREAPGLHLQVRAIDQSCHHEDLEAGEIDLAIGPVRSKRPGLHVLALWRDRLVTLVAKDNPLADPMTLEAFAAAAHVVDSGHVQVSPDGQGTSIVDAILAARGLRRKIVVALPSSAGVPFVVATTDLIATLPSRMVKDLAPVPNLRIVPAPLPEVEVSPHMIWHEQTHSAPLQVWLRALIAEIAADTKSH
jgi:DNA-binding transcriptional LysR family regulator